MNENMYAFCGVGAHSKARCMLIYYSSDDNAPEKEISVNLGKKSVNIKNIANLHKRWYNGYAYYFKGEKL